MKVGVRKGKQHRPLDILTERKHSSITKAKGLLGALLLLLFILLLLVLP